MYFFQALLYVLSIMTLVETGVAFPSKIRSKREQFGVIWERNRENIEKIDLGQERDATYFPTEEYVESTKKYTSTEVTNVATQFQRTSSHDRPHNRNKRKFYPYLPHNTNGIQLRSRIAWQPTKYPLQQPYYIPVYGKEGTTPVYIPQQPMYVNAEDSPQDSETLPIYIGGDLSSASSPTYFPIVPSETENSEKNKRFTFSLIGDQPIWDTTKMPEPSEFNQITGFPIVEDEAEDLDYNQFLPPTIERPEKEPGSRQARSPNNCVLAIVSCCSVASNEVNVNCFEQFGCSGPFWDVNPCEKEFVTAAVEKTMNFYSSLRNRMKHPE